MYFALTFFDRNKFIFHQFSIYGVEDSFQLPEDKACDEHTTACVRSGIGTYGITWCCLLPDKIEIQSGHRGQCSIYLSGGDGRLS